jgi:tetratricopeptide (TPR) repeat protein
MQFWKVFSLIWCAVMLMGCSSKPPANETQSASQGDQSQKVSDPQSAKAGSDDAGSISYAKNPERFVRVPVVEPPFNLTDPKTATDFFDVGVHEDNLHHYDKAITAYEKALKLEPGWTLICLREAKDYKRLGKRNDAIAQLRQAIKVDPHYWDAYSELASLTRKWATPTRCRGGVEASGFPSHADPRPQPARILV